MKIAALWGLKLILMFFWLILFIRVTRREQRLDSEVAESNMEAFAAAVIIYYCNLNDLTFGQLYYCVYMLCSPPPAFSLLSNITQLFKWVIYIEQAVGKCQA